MTPLAVKMVDYITLNECIIGNSSSPKVQFETQGKTRPLRNPMIEIHRTKSMESEDRRTSNHMQQRELFDKNYSFSFHTANNNLKGDYNSNAPYDHTPPSI